MSHTDYIFLYGTLRKELFPNRHQLIAEYCDFVCNGSIQGQLFEIDGYPGAVESTTATDRVLGEVYLLLAPGKALQTLDDYEECSAAHLQPHEYYRKRLLISSPNQPAINAWVYLYNWSVAQRKRIVSGDYRKFAQDTK